jgi:hypothetical protein
MPTYSSLHRWLRVQIGRNRDNRAMLHHYLYRLWILEMGQIIAAAA